MLLSKIGALVSPVSCLQPSSGLQRTAAAVAKGFGRHAAAVRVLIDASTVCGAVVAAAAAFCYVVAGAAGADVQVCCVRASLKRDAATRKRVQVLLVAQICSSRACL